MNRIVASILMLALALCAYALHFSTNYFPFSTLEEDLTVTIGPDTTLCQSGESVDFRPVVSNPDVFQARWSPGAAVLDSTQLNTSGVFDTSTTLVLTVSTITETELILNGDFQNGDTGFSSDYNYGNSTSNIGILAPENTYAITNDPPSVHRRFDDCRHWGGNGNMMVVNGSGIPNNVWCQQITIEPNTDYVFSAWLVSMTDENPARLQFSINGELLGDEMQASTNFCDWRQFFATWNSGAGTLAEICIVNVNNNPAGNDFALDDISFRQLCVARDTIQVDVAELNPAWSGPASFCSDEDPIDLNTFLAAGATAGGTWTLDGAPVDTLDPAILPPGDHELAYAVQQAQCREELAQTIAILEVLSAGTPLEPAQFCLPANEIVQLVDRLEGADPGGVWTETSAAPSTGNAFNAAQGTFDLSGQAPGLYTFRYAQTAPAGCTGSEAEISIRIDPSPTADAGPPMTFDCAIDMLTIGGTNTSFGSEFSYQWTALNGSPIESPDQALTEITRADTYTLIVQNTQTGCSDTSSVVINSETEPPTLYARSVPISCPGEADGQIIVDSIVGGQPPYSLFLNGGLTSLNEPIDNLVAGLYTLAVEDVNGCTDGVEFNLVEPAPAQVNIRQEEIGDSISLRIETDLSPTSIRSVDWSPAICTQCFSSVITAPAVSTEYSVSLTDDRGCTYSATITVEGRSATEQAEGLFIPNAFSPNEDGNNDYFTIFSAKGQASNIKMMQIVDRWGNLLFSKQDFPPDEPSAGWDGFYKGQRLNAGVFIYVAEVEMTDGTSVVVRGDIALVY